MIDTILNVILCVLMYVFIFTSVNTGGICKMSSLLWITFTVIFFITKNTQFLFIAALYWIAVEIDDLHNKK